MNIKRAILICCLIILTAGCYVFMNRNYDPLARYQYDLDDKTKALVLEKLNDREIKYIIDYAIDINSFYYYLDNGNFNIYHLKEYEFAKPYLYKLNDHQIVNVVENLLKKDVDFEYYINRFLGMTYDEILYIELGL